MQPKLKHKRVVISTRFDAELLERADLEAKRLGVSRARLIEYALECLLNKTELAK